MCKCACVKEKERKKGRGNKETVRTATDGLMFVADEKETLKKEGRDHTDKGQGWEERGVGSKREEEVEL